MSRSVKLALRASPNSTFSGVVAMLAASMVGRSPPRRGYRPDRGGPELVSPAREWYERRNSGRRQRDRPSSRAALMFEDRRIEVAEMVRRCVTSAWRALAAVIVIGLILASVSASGGANRWVDRRGNVIYSDRPPRPEEVGREGDRADPGVAAPSAAVPPSLRPFDPSVERLLDATGLKHQARLVAFQTRGILYGNLGALDAEHRRRVDAITDRYFHPDNLYTLLRSELSRYVNEARLNEVLAWYGTPVGRRVATAEVRFYASDRRREVEGYVAGLVNNKPSPLRLALMQRLDAATGATEGSLDLFVAINRSIIRVVEPLMPADRRLGSGQLESQARQIRLRMQESLKQVNIVTMLFLYQGVTDDELRRYIEFMESEAGAWYGTAARQAIVAAITSSVERTAGELVRVVPPERWVGGGLTRPPVPSEKLKL